MAIEHSFHLGELLDSNDFENLYVKLIKENNKKVHFKVYSLVGNIEREEKFHCLIENRNHKIEFSTFDIFYDFLNCQSDFGEVCARADYFNKEIVGYIGTVAKTKTKYWVIRCLDCNSEIVQRKNLFSSCKFCNDKNKVTNLEDFIKKSSELHNSRYSYDDVNYKNSKCKVKIFCKLCNSYFHQSVSSHLCGSGCPKCKRSKGELRIEKYLNESNISFISQKYFDGLVYRGLLKYDFYLSDLNLLIEFDGLQHFEPVNFCNNLQRAIEDFNLVQLRDKLKNEWAKKNNIPLLRISYRDYCNIEKLVNEFILRYSRKETVQLSLDL